MKMLDLRFIGTVCRSKILYVAYVALLYMLLSFSSYIRFYYGLIPITMQTFVLFLIGYYLNWKESLVVVSIHVFIERFYAISSPTGGFLIGFIFFIFVINIIKHYFQKENLCIQLLMITLSHLLLFVFGSVFLKLFFLPSTFISFYEGLIKFIPVLFCVKLPLIILSIRIHSVLYPKFTKTHQS